MAFKPRQFIWLLISEGVIITSFPHNPSTTTDDAANMVHPIHPLAESESPTTKVPGSTLTFGDTTSSTDILTVSSASPPSSRSSTSVPNIPPIPTSSGTVVPIITTDITPTTTVWVTVSPTCSSTASSNSRNKSSSQHGQVSIKTAALTYYPLHTPNSITDWPGPEPTSTTLVSLQCPPHTSTSSSEGNIPLSVAPIGLPEVIPITGCSSSTVPSGPPSKLFDKHVPVGPDYFLSMVPVLDDNGSYVANLRL